MKLTVLITTFNHERFIEKALESVIGQKTTFPFEVVVIEDCSTDRTREIVVAFQRRHPERVRLHLADRNRNDYAAWRREIVECRSEFVAFLDGDDYWTSELKLQKQVEFLETFPDCAMCYHNARVFHDDGTDREAYDFHLPGRETFSTIDDLWDGNYIPGCSPMLRVKSINPLPSWMVGVLWADWAIFLLAARNGSIGYLDEVLGAYRIHMGGVWSGMNRPEQLRTTIAFYHFMNQKFDFAYNAIISKLICDRTERLRKAELTLRDNRLPDPFPAYNGPGLKLEVRTKAILPAQPAPPEVKPVIQFQVRCRCSRSGEARLVWGLNKFTQVPSDLPPGTFLTYNDSHMNTPMRREGNEFVVELEIAENTQIDYGLSLTCTWCGTSIEEWHGSTSVEDHYYYSRKLTVEDADETAIDSRTYVGKFRSSEWCELRTNPIVSPTTKGCGKPEVMRVQVLYHNPQANEVVVVWGLDGFTNVPDDLPPGTFLTYNNSHMNTPMRREEDLFVAEMDVPGDSRLDYAFAVTRTSSGEPVNLWKGADSTGAYFTARLSAAGAKDEAPATQHADRWKTEPALN